MPQSYDDWVCGQFRDVEKEKREMEEREMKKIELSTDTGSKAEMIGGFWAIEYKLNEMVKWINERDEERVEEYELMRKWIDKIDKWINKHEKHSQKE